MDLNELEREGALRIRTEVPGDAELWGEADLPFAPDTGLGVDLNATMAGTGKVLVRGDLRGRFRRACRRCLDEVEQEFEQEMTVLYVPPEEADEEDEEIRALEPRGHLLDVSDAVREEVILGAPRYAVCDPECQGLCPNCGVNLNDNDCDCTLEEPDPRWDALRELVED